MLVVKMRRKNGNVMSVRSARIASLLYLLIISEGRTERGTERWKEMQGT